MTVSGSGFPATANIVITECEGTAVIPPTDPTNCDGGVSDTTTYADRTGAFIDAAGGPDGGSGFVVKTLAQNGVLGINCDVNHPCVLYVGVQLDDFTQPHTFVDLHWAASAVGVPGPATTVAPSPTTSAPPTTAALGATSAGVGTGSAAGGGGANTPDSGSGSGAGTAAAVLPSGAQGDLGAAGLPRTGAPTDLLAVALGGGLLVGASAAIRHRVQRVDGRN